MTANAARPDVVTKIRALVTAAEKTVSGRLRLADDIKVLLDLAPAACDHEWSQRGTADDRWRECWMCGIQEDA